jgi:transposase
LKDLEKADKNFFEKRTDFPKFKRKGSGDAFRYLDSKQIKSPLPAKTSCTKPQRRLAKTTRP